MDRNNANADDVSGSVIAIRHSASGLRQGADWPETSQATNGITEVASANLSHFASQNSAR